MSGLGPLAPFGLLSFGPEPTEAEVIYEALKAGQGQAYSTEIGSLTEATLYARALALGCAKSELVRAGAQANPLDLTAEILPLREKENGIVPSPYASLHERRVAVALKTQLSRGARRENVVDLLTQALGSDFVAFRTVKKTEAVSSPTTPDNTTGNWISLSPTHPRKLFRLVDPVLFTGDHQDIAYEAVPGANPSDLLDVGDRVVIDPGNPGRCEVIEVTVSTKTADPPTFAGVFRLPHDPGVLITNQRFPRQITNRRHSLVVVTAAAARDPEKRRKIHEILRGVMRATSSWTITCETAPGSLTTGPFKVGVGKLGITTIGTVTLP